MRIALAASALAVANAAVEEHIPGTGLGGLLRAANFRAPSTLAKTPMMAEAEAEAEKKPVEAADAEGPVSKGANDGWGIGMMVDPGFARLDDDEQDALARQQNSVGGEADFEGNQWFQIGADDEAEGDASQGQGQGVPVPAVTGVRPGGLLDSIFGLIDVIQSQQRERVGMDIDIDMGMGMERPPMQAPLGHGPGPRGPRQDFEMQTELPEFNDQLETMISSDEELWMASVQATQQACAVDFATRCGEYDEFEPELDRGFDDMAQGQGQGQGQFMGQGQIMMLPPQGGFFFSISSFFDDDRDRSRDQRPMDGPGPRGPGGPGGPEGPGGHAPPPPHGPGGFRRLGGKHGHGHGGHGPPHHRHQRRHLLHHGMDGHHHDHDHHGEGHGMGAGHGGHFDHGEEGEGEGRPHKCGGPLGFGSREADMCLRTARDELSAGCQDAIAQTEAIFRELNDEDDFDFNDMPPPHHIGGGMFILMLLSVCLCRRCSKKNRRAKVKHVLKTLHENPELKAAVEDAAGTPLPLPGWKCKMVQAINANPELKAAVEDAAQMQMPLSHGRNNRVAQKQGDAKTQTSRCGRCCALLMIVFGTCFLVSLFSAVISLCDGGMDMDGDEGMNGMVMTDADGNQILVQGEGEEAMSSPPPEADPLAGFFFSIFFGFLLIMTCTLCCKCLRCLYKQCCKCEGKAAEYPGAAKGNNERLLRREGTELTVVYVGLPASPEDVPALNKL